MTDVLIPLIAATKGWSVKISNYDLLFKHSSIHVTPEHTHTLIYLGFSHMKIYANTTVQTFLCLYHIIQDKYVRYHCMEKKHCILFNWTTCTCPWSYKYGLILNHNLKLQTYKNTLHLYLYLYILLNIKLHLLYTLLN